MARVLVACEYSGRVRDAFIRAGHDAWSCDLLPSEADPRRHIQGDVRAFLTGMAKPWDMLIAFPDCTYLTCAAEWAYGPGPYHQRVKPGTLTGAARHQARADAIAFVLHLWKAPIKHIAIENPVGVLSAHLGRPQVIQPHQFGDNASKATCIWRRRLPKLVPTNEVAPRIVNGRPRWANQTDSGQNRLTPGPDRWKERSRTFEGIAQAMADQWGPLLSQPADLFAVSP